MMDYTTFCKNLNEDRRLVFLMTGMNDFSHLS